MQDFLTSWAFLAIMLVLLLLLLFLFCMGVVASAGTALLLVARRSDRGRGESPA